MPKGDNQPSLDELREQGKIPTEQDADEIVDPEDVNNESSQPNNQSDDTEPDININDEYNATVQCEWLPSQGILYPFDEIKIRPLKNEEIKYLKSANSVRGFRNRIRSLLNNVTETIDSKNLTYGDEIPLYIRVRVETWSEFYKVDFQCQNPSCEEENKMYNYDLRTVEMNYLPDDYSEPIECEFADSDVKLRCLRVRDVEQVDTYVQNNKNKYEDKGVAELNMSARQALMLDDVEGVQDRITKKIKYIDNEMSREEYTDGLEAFEKLVAHGLDFSMNVTCKHCQTDFETQLPFKSSLFYPDPDPDTLDKFKVNG